MKFKPDEIVSVLRGELRNLGAGQDVREVGRVLEVGDGIARVYGLSGVMAGEMVEFASTGIRGLAFNLEESSVAVIILGDYLKIQEGDEVRGVVEQGRLARRVPVGDDDLVAVRGLDELRRLQRPVEGVQRDGADPAQLGQGALAVEVPPHLRRMRQEDAGRRRAHAKLSPSAPIMILRSSAVSPVWEMNESFGTSACLPLISPGA